VTITNRVSLKSVEFGITPIDDVPDAPTVGTATNVGTSRAFNNGAATVTYTAAPTGGPVTTFTATSTPGSFTGTGTSPITVTGLQSATSYTFTVSAANANGTLTSASSSSITATTIPQVPTIGTATVASGQSYTGSANTSVTFTPGATGGASATYTVTSSSGNTGTGSSSPISVSDSVGTARTYTVTATNANGTTAASSASNSVTPVSVPQAPTIGTATAGNGTASVTFTAGATGGSTITGYTVTSSPGGLTGTGSASPITVSGLTNGTAYTFTVTATNSAGTSAASSASSAVTPTLPALGAWSVSTSVPNSSNTITQGQGAGNTSLIWVGGGIYNGETVIPNGYKWTGSSWSASNMNIDTYQTIVQRLTASGSSNSLMRIGSYTSGFSITNTTAIYNGSSWSAGSVFPKQGLGIGFASLDGTGNVRTVGGNALGGPYTWYQTSFGGAWTQNGVDSPILNNQYATGVDNNFGGKGWFWRQNNSAAYECTSVTSAWSALTSAPWGDISNAFYVNQTVVSEVVMVVPQYNSSPIGGKPYTFNGTTYTVQTALTAVPNWDYSVLGAVGNVVSFIRQQGTPNTNENYHYRATFA